MPKLPLTRPRPRRAAALALTALVLGAHGWLAHGWLWPAEPADPGAASGRAGAGNVRVRQIPAPPAPAATARSIRPDPRTQAANITRPDEPPSRPADRPVPNRHAPRPAPPSPPDVPAAPGEAQVPDYPTRLPPSATLEYLVRRADAIGLARLEWQASNGNYSLAIVTRMPGSPPLGRTSRGRIDVHGLAPDRYVESRRGREQRAANFRRDSGRITFSGPPVEVPLWPGAQDRASWTVQLAGIVRADPQRAAPGKHIRLFVVGARGDARPWDFEVLGPEELSLPGGPVHTLRLRREPEQPYDTRAEVWLDPSRGHLPVRVRWQAPPAAEATEWLLRAPEEP